jgi:hypothetical protein
MHKPSLEIVWTCNNEFTLLVGIGWHIQKMSEFNYSDNFVDIV